MKRWKRVETKTGSVNLSSAMSMNKTMELTINEKFRVEQGTMIMYDYNFVGMSPFDIFLLHGRLPEENGRQWKESKGAMNSVYYFQAPESKGCIR